jgi:hypothetical protein
MSILVTRTLPDSATGRASSELRASGIARRRTEEERAEAPFPLRATTTAADPKRDARAAPKKRETSIISGSERAAYGQQLDLGAVGDEVLDGIEHLHEMRPVGAHRGYPDTCPSVQLKMINFGHTQLKAFAHVGDQRAYQRALLLERMHIAEQQVELQRTHPHGHGHSVDTGPPEGH